MSDSRVQADQGTANVYIDAVTVNTTAGTGIERQRVAIADATAGETNLVINPDGSASISGQVSVANFPSSTSVSGSVGVTNFPGSFGINNFPATQAVSGSVSVLDFPANQVVSGSVGVTNFPGSFLTTVSGSVSVLNATDVVSGSVGVTNFPGSFAVNNLPAIQAVSGSVSVLDFPSNQVVSGSVGVTNFPGSFGAVQITSPWVTSGSVSINNYPSNQVVSGSVSVLEAGSWSVIASGSVSVLNPSSSSTAASVSVLNFPAIQTVAGSVSVLDFPAVQAVSGSVSVLDFPASQTVAGSVGVTNFPGSFLSTVSGSVSVLNPFTVDVVSGSVSVNNYPSNQVVSGSVFATNFANPVGVEFVDSRPTAASITNYDPSTVASVGQNNSIYYTGAASVPSFVSVAINGEGDVRSLLSGTWTGTIQYEGSVDNGTTWTALAFNVVGTGYRQAAWTANGLGYGICSGLTNIRARALPSSWTGVALVTFTFSSEDGIVKVDNPISIWDNNTGLQAQIQSASVAPAGGAPAVVVSSTDYQGSSPWIISGSVSANNYPSNQVVSGSVSVIEAGQWSAVVSGSVSVNNYPSIQVVSGSVSVNNYPSLQQVAGSVTALEGSTWYTLNEYTSASTLPVATSPPATVVGMSDKFGRQISIPQAPRDLIGQSAFPITNTTAASVAIPGLASTFTDISSIIFANTSATGTTATLSDGTNSYYYYCPPTDMRGAAYQVPLPATAASTQWTVTTGTAVSSVDVTIIYIKNK